MDQPSTSTSQERTHLYSQPTINASNTGIITPLITPRTFKYRILLYLLLGTLLCLIFGLSLLLTWTTIYIYSHYSFGISNELMKYPLTLSSISYLACFLFTVPGLISSTIRGENRSFWLPWACITELVFVGYIGLIYFLFSPNQTPDQTNLHRSIYHTVIGLDLLLVFLFTLPWKQERAGIITLSSSILVSIGTVLSADSDPWTWNTFFTEWAWFLVSLVLAFGFAVFVIISRKSMTNSSTGIYQLFFMHIIFGTVFSTLGALICEVYAFDLSWNKFYNEWVSLKPERLVITIACAIFFKFGTILIGRITDTHTLALGLHLGVALVLIAPRFFGSQTVSAWAHDHPRKMVGYVILFLGVLYWFVRAIRWQWKTTKMTQETTQNDSDIWLRPVPAD